MSMCRNNDHLPKRLQSINGLRKMQKVIPSLTVGFIITITFAEILGKWIFFSLFIAIPIGIASVFLTYLIIKKID
jgi:hypothetical protein